MGLLTKCGDPSDIYQSNLCVTPHGHIAFFRRCSIIVTTSLMSLIISEIFTLLLLLSKLCHLTTINHYSR